MHVYNNEIAKHYAAYRPPLHELILGEVLSGERFSSGLDIGCGTGRSSVALLQFCSQVFGLDTSNHMLQNAVNDPNLTYRLITNATWPVEDNSYDVVTFAGVLPYLDEKNTTRELSRVCRNHALIIPYDFEVQFETLLRILSIQLPQAYSSYDHSRNLSQSPSIQTSTHETRCVELAANPEEAAHVMMSDMTIYTALASAMGGSGLYDKVVAAIRASSWAEKLHAKIHYALHTLR